MPLGILSVIIGYILGSIPTAYIVSRVSKGIDIRTIGSGNMGGANVMREIGTNEGVFVGLFDLAKGAGVILIAQSLNVSELWIFGTGFTAVVGHNFPVFASFRGGRGSATIIGIFLVLAPMAALVTLAVVAIPFFASRKFGGGCSHRICPVAPVCLVAGRLVVTGTLCPGHRPLHVGAQSTRY
jgi:glycerol-3-phosphate acyltransferase PlsY